MPQENKPPRKLFHISESGQGAFLAWVQNPVDDGRSLRLEFLIKLYFARAEGGEVASSLLAAQQSLCEAWLVSELELFKNENSNHRRYSSLIHQFRAGQIQAMLAWLELCEKA
jgi:hypothetical protein